MTKAIRAAAVLLALLAAPSLQAQDASVLSPGTRVRLSSPALDGTVQTGKIVSSSRDTISFRGDVNPITRTLAVADISSIEISGGQETHRGRDALYGLAIGGGAGALIGAATYKKTDQPCFFFCDTRSSDAVAGAFVGGLAGTLIGAFIVGNFDKSERWISLRRTASFRVMPAAGGARVAVSAAF